MTTTTTTPVTVTPPPAPPATYGWEERIKLFCQSVGKNVEEVSLALRSLVGEPGPEALAALSDPTAVFDSDLEVALVKGGPMIPLGIFRKNLAKLRGPQTAPEALSERTPSFDLLPTVPEDGSFLEMLKVGGVLKPAKTEVIAAIKAALAHKLGVFDLPDVILEKMESFADQQDEPVGESFYRLRRLVVTRNYSEVLSALGADGTFVSSSRKKVFLAKLDEYLWAEIQGFYSQLHAWQETWMAGVASPVVALSMIAVAGAGPAGGRSMMPPGMMQPPETAGIRDASEAVIDKINKVFAGVGIAVARALAFDATRIKGVLEEPTLPVAVGAGTREQMLKMLGVTVGADYVRLERNITRFVLAIMELSKVPAGHEELAYLSAMIQLGASIPWAKLPGSPTPVRAGIAVERSPLGGTRR